MTTEQRSRRQVLFTMVAEVRKDLERLGLAPVKTDRDGVSYHTLPTGLGWCQAFYAPEEAWPPGAELCVLVQWRPAGTYRRDYPSGRLPARAQEHWTERIAATVRELESIGYLVAVSGPPRAAHLHSYEEILVWRLGPGQLNTWPPTGAWDGLEPARPNFKTGPNSYTYPERHPGEALKAALGKLRAATPSGRAYMMEADPALWPPFAEYCARVIWEPAEPFQPLPDGTVPDGAAEHWRHGIESVRQQLQAADYRVRTAERPLSPAVDEKAGFLVWKSRVPAASSYGGLPRHEPPSWPGCRSAGAGPAQPLRPCGGPS